MKIVLFGAPGAGKGTQAQKISEEYNIPHISTGDLLRKNIEEKTEIGLVALEYIERGKLAPDELVMRLLDDVFAHSERGFLLDGFPRTIAQAESLSKITDIDAVIDIEVDENAVVDRIVNRMVCPQCGRSYNKKLHTALTCECGATLTKRKDDTEEVVKERLAVYAAQTKPIIGYYDKLGKTLRIDGNGDIDTVYERIKKALNDNRKK